MKKTELFTFLIITCLINIQKISCTQLQQILLQGRNAHNEHHYHHHHHHHHHHDDETTSELVNSFINEFMSEITAEEEIKIKESMNTVNINSIASNVVVEVQDEVIAHVDASDTDIENISKDDLTQSIVQQVMDSLMSIEDSTSVLSGTDEINTADSLKELLQEIFSYILKMNIQDSSVSIQDMELPANMTSSLSVPESEIVKQIVDIVQHELSSFLDEQGDLEVPELNEEGMVALQNEIITQITNAVDLSSITDENLKMLINEVSGFLLDDLVNMPPFPGMGRISLRQNINSFITRVTEIAIEIVNRIVSETSSIPITSSPTFAITEFPTSMPTSSPTTSLVTSSPTQMPTVATTLSNKGLLVQEVISQLDQWMTQEGVQRPQDLNDDAVNSKVMEILKKEDDIINSDLSTLDTAELEALGIKIAEIILEDYIKEPIAKGGEVNLVNQDLSEITNAIQDIVNDLRPPSTTNGNLRHRKLLMSAQVIKTKSKEDVTNEIVSNVMQELDHADETSSHSNKDTVSLIANDVIDHVDIDSMDGASVQNLIDNVSYLIVKDQNIIKEEDAVPSVNSMVDNMLGMFSPFLTSHEKNKEQSNQVKLIDSNNEHEEETKVTMSEEDMEAANEAIEEIVSQILSDLNFTQADITIAEMSRSSNP